MSETKHIGIIGDGQLGRMLTEAALPMGYDVTVLGMAGPDSPAAQVGAHQLEGELTDPEAITRLVEQSDVTTWEIEHIHARALVELEEAGHTIHPSPGSLAKIQDKLTQKFHLKKHGIDVAPFTHLEDADDFTDIRAQFGESFIAKARRGGYDGRSNMLVTPAMTWTDVTGRFGVQTGQTGLYAEKLVSFQRELSVVGARSMAGKIALYPVVETVHNANHVCEWVFAPAALDEKVRAAAWELGRETIKAFDGAGVFAVEMFQDENDNVLVNEVAPRVHNSGHWTDLGSETSQFEQHIRAITGQQLGSTFMRYRSAVMLNILSTPSGRFEPAMRQTQPVHQGHVRWYGKAPRPGAERKIGHITSYGLNPAKATINAESINQAYAK